MLNKKRQNFSTFTNVGVHLFMFLLRIIDFVFFLKKKKLKKKIEKLNCPSNVFFPLQNLNQKVKKTEGYLTSNKLACYFLFKIIIQFLSYVYLYSHRQQYHNILFNFYIFTLCTLLLYKYILNRLWIQAMLLLTMYLYFISL